MHKWILYNSAILDCASFKPHNPLDDGPEYKINEDPMDKVEKALATPFPRDVEKIEDEKYEDVMHRVVNHAHQRNPNKKWS